MVVRTATLGVLIAIAVGVLYPIFFSINVALKTPTGFIDDPFGLAWPPSLDAMATMWKLANIPRSFANSLLVSVTSLFLLWIVGGLAGFAFTKLHFRGRNLLFLVVLMPLLIPLQAILVPFFLVMKQLGLLNEYIGLILAHVAFGAPLTTFIFAAYFRGIPQEILDAARVDGATTLRLIWSVILPISRPVLATSGILNFVSTMNSLLLPILVLSKPDRQVLMVNIAMARGQWVDEPTTSAAGVLFGILPMLILGLLAQRHLVKGATAGAVR